VASTSEQVGGATDRVSAAELAKAVEQLIAVSNSFSSRIVGQGNLRWSLLIALLAGGHVLLESVPGLAKTMAANTLATSVKGQFNRIQCTPDLLPSDITGTQIFDSKTNSFTTQLGPVHANFVLLDEINRSSAKTQSAMLEAMQERQTSIGGTVYKVPSPFLVIATQNPIEQEGTYLLPEAQLDRFLIKEIVYYPTIDEELEILDRLDRGVFSANGATEGVISLDDVLALQELTGRIYIDTALRRYIVSLVSATRTASSVIGDRLGSLVEVGASPRGSIAFVQAARAYALLNGRGHVIPEDVKAIAHRVLRHRIILGFEADAEGVTTDEVITAIVAAIPAP
jgi:MoxR-like ATPase